MHFFILKRKEQLTIPPRYTFHQGIMKTWLCVSFTEMLNFRVITTAQFTTMIDLTNM